MVSIRLAITIVLQLHCMYIFLSASRSNSPVAIVGGSIGGFIILLGLAVAIGYSYWKRRLRLDKTAPTHIRKEASWVNFQVTNQLVVSPTLLPDEVQAVRNFPKPSSAIEEAVPIS